jgi:hypothetical protein
MTLVGVLNSLAGGEKRGSMCIVQVLYHDESFIKLAEPTTLAEMPSFKLLSTLAGRIKHFTLHDVVEITNGKPCKSSELWRSAAYHFWVAEFLLHKNKASNTLYKSTVYTITRKEHFRFSCLKIMFEPGNPTYHQSCGLMLDGRSNC